jgi:phosphoglycerate kinase
MEIQFKTLGDKDVQGKRVIVRADLNLPITHGQISDQTRLERLLPTLRELKDKGAKIILLSHFGRPKGRDMKHSLAPVASALEAAMADCTVKFVSDCIGPDAVAASQSLRAG